MQPWRSVILNVKNIRNYSGGQSHKPSRAPQSSRGSNVVRKATSILIMLLGFLDPLSFTILVKVYVCGIATSRICSSCSNWKNYLRKQCRRHTNPSERNVMVSLKSPTPDTYFFYHVCALTWTPHKYQDACQVWFMPTKREDFVAIMAFQCKEFVTPIPVRVRLSELEEFDSFSTNEAVALFDPVCHADPFSLP